MFYASWKWQFCFLLLAVSLFNWAYGRWVLQRASGNWALGAGVAANLAALVYFKYANFFVSGAASVLQAAGADWRPAPLDIILPLGISFFTFQGIAYLFDVAGGDEPLSSLTDFLLFKAMWAQLIAGPIVRLGEVRSQIEGRRTIDYDAVSDGGRRILQGAFKKTVLADGIASYVDMVFLPGASPHGIDVIAGTVGFALQIYFDFSAYSDIAIGSARLFGFRFPENFDWPYTATSPQDFWNRWHMTLSRWIRDYVFAPLNFASRRYPRLAPVWLLAAMAICGLWHGAQWTFVLWGVWHGVLLVANHTFAKGFFHDAASSTGREHRFRRAVRSAVTLTLIGFGWILFRAGSVSQAVDMYGAMFSMKGGLRPSILRENAILLIGLLGCGLLVAQLAAPMLRRIGGGSGAMRVAIRLAVPAGYAAMLAAIIIFDKEARAFVYFQF